MKLSRMLVRWLKSLSGKEEGGSGSGLQTGTGSPSFQTFVRPAERCQRGITQTLGNRFNGQFFLTESLAGQTHAQLCGVR